MILLLSLLMTSCVSTQKYNLLVQSMQRNVIEKQQIADSLQSVKSKLEEANQKEKQDNKLKGSQLDSLRDKYLDLQVSYIDLEKNVFVQNQEFQKNKNNFKSQLAQRDSLLSQIISQSKELMAENQRLSSEIKNTYLPANSLIAKDSSKIIKLNTLQSNIYEQIKNFIGKEIGLEKQEDKIRILLAHQLLFQDGKLSEDGSFVLSMLAKVLKNEKDTELTILNYTSQEEAEKDTWEIGMSQFLEVIKTLNKNGVRDNQFRQISTSSEVAVYRLEILIGVK